MYLFSLGICLVKVITFSLYFGGCSFAELTSFRMKYLVSLRSIGELALENLVYLRAVRLTESLALTKAKAARGSAQSAC